SPAPPSTGRNCSPCTSVERLVNLFPRSIHFFRNNQQYLHRGSLPLRPRRPELPSPQRRKHETPPRIIRWKCHRQRFQLPCFVQDSVHHQRIRVQVARRKVGPENVIRPRRLQPVHRAARGHYGRLHLRVLQDPRLLQS